MKNTFRMMTLVMSVTGMTLAQQPMPVQVEGGMVQGTSENGLTVYRGIPFAAPPVGDLRWRASQPAVPWKGVRQADQFAPGPMQGGNPPSGKSEDCLYLNVWTPAKSADERIPVLVWIYGGGSVLGPHPNGITVGNIWPRKAWYWSVLPTASGNWVFWPIRS